jgi:hypothetical protein
MNRLFIYFTFIIALLFFSCGTIDRGFHGDVNLPKEERVTLYTGAAVDILEFDNEKVKWEKNSWDVTFDPIRKQRIQINSGEHTFKVRYSSNVGRTDLILMKYNFEAGKTYMVYASKVKWPQVIFDIMEYVPKE